MKALLSLALLVTVASCVPQALCSKKQECDPELNDDSYNVCMTAYDARISALRANAEPECQRLADATLALDSCRAALDCDDFDEGDLGQKCDELVDDFNDARNDTVTRGQDRCSAAN